MICSLFKETVTEVEGDDGSGTSLNGVLRRGC